MKNLLERVYLSQDTSALPAIGLGG
jgi:hypothetical protein